jgi:hypothetical protein
MTDWQKLFNSTPAQAHGLRSSQRDGMLAQIEAVRTHRKDPKKIPGRKQVPRLQV